MASPDNNATADMELVMPFLQAVLGAHSITISTLGEYGKPVSAATGPDRDLRADLRQIQSLCRELGRDASGADGLRTLLDLRDTFVAQGRQVSSDQKVQAEQLARSYIDWVFATFSEKIKLAE